MSNDNGVARALERFENKLDRVSEDVTETKLTLVKQHATLEEHQRRSLALEQEVELLQKNFEPIRERALAWGYFGKALAVVGTLVGIGAALVKILEKLGGPR